MSTVTKATAKGYFETGDTPTQTQFENLIDSTLFPDEQNVPLKEYTTTTPSIPSTGSLLFSRKRAGLNIPSFCRPLVKRLLYRRLCLAIK
jgi:hypothetical protein